MKHDKSRRKEKKKEIISYIIYIIIVFMIFITSPPPLQHFLSSNTPLKIDGSLPELTPLNMSLMYISTMSLYQNLKGLVLRQNSMHPSMICAKILLKLVVEQKIEILTGMIDDDGLRTNFVTETLKILAPACNSATPPP